MATSQPAETTGMSPQASSVHPEETEAVADEAAPAADVLEASTSPVNAAAASQEQGSIERADIPTATIAGPSTVAEHDPAPIQPAIQPVRILSNFLTK